MSGHHGHHARHARHAHRPDDPNRGVVRADTPDQEALVFAAAVGVTTLVVLTALLAAIG